MARVWTSSSLVCIAVGCLGGPPECAKCHPRETESYANTGMGRSFGLARASDFQFVHDASGTRFRVTGGMHEAARSGLVARYPVAVRIGSGKVGSSFAVRIEDRLFQSPISWYAQREEFRISPGFESEKYPDFDRPIRDECLSCHTSGPAGAVKAIGCERCHGPAQSHQLNPSAANIVNPAQLAEPAASSVCEQCHLGGAARVLNPGQTFSDFVPGKALEDYWTVYVGGGDFRVTSHPEQLALSRCRTSDGTAIACWTCHNPHPTAKLAARSTDSVCGSCHKPHDGGELSCATCHMPKRATKDVVHVAYTDHRIQRPGRPAAILGPLRAWRQAAPPYVDRNWALALFMVGEQKDERSTVQEALRLLSRASSEADPEALTAIGSIWLRRGRPTEAAASLHRVVDLRPADAVAWFRLGLAEKAIGKPSYRDRLEKAIQADPLFLEPYAVLADSYRSQGDMVGFAATLRRYLKHVPQSLAVRRALSQAEPIR